MLKLKLLAFVILGGAVVLTSCSKEKMTEQTDSMIQDLIRSGSMITVQSINYTRSETQSLEQTSIDSPYHTGIIEYSEAGNLVADVDFSQGGTDAATLRLADGSSSSIALKKENIDNKYKKVVIEPLVYSEECGYIVAGIIKFYDFHNGAWVATFDYGDGTCDEFINKDTNDGNSNFSMNDYPEWNN